MDRVFDSHFHLLFKHHVSRKPDNTEFSIDVEIKTKDLGKVANDLFGGPFDSQASPFQVKDSILFLGITSILSMEHAFANQILKRGPINLAPILPLDFAMVNRTKHGDTSYFEEFEKQLDYHIKKGNKTTLEQKYKIYYLKRNDELKKKNAEEIKLYLFGEDKDRRWFALSIEGGHNLSTQPVRQKSPLPVHPERQLEKLQNRDDCDIISLNLCHLSHIPEQYLGGFAQGHNGLAMLAFKSDDFHPVHDIGLSEEGKRVIKQAYLHPKKPVVIDVKHMSLYTRLQFYKYRNKLIREHPQVQNIPIISSHSGFTFISTDEFLNKEKFETGFNNKDSEVTKTWIVPDNRKIGKWHDATDKGYYCNPWTINFFDDEIVEIMASGGLIGISIDQRIIGAIGATNDGKLDEKFSKEHIANKEWEKLFKKKERPAEEGLFTPKDKPGKVERHYMNFCLHIIHAVRVGYSQLSWLDDNSPWKHLCIGSDFDGMINPIDGLSNVKDFKKLKAELEKYLPIADKLLLTYPETKGLKYDLEGNLDKDFLDKAISDFLYNNGERLIIRFLQNWNIQ